MIALIQRVRHASVEVGGEIVGRIGTGMLALIGVQPDDDDKAVARMLDRLLGYRIFEDAHGRMNLNLRSTGGGLLLVPQFTLAADTHKGTRPSFSSAAPPELAQLRFEALVAAARMAHPAVECGRFGADMAVNLTNMGPVTFWLDA